MTVAEAAERLGISVATVRRRIDAGELKAVREMRPQGSRYLVVLDDAARGGAPEVPSGRPTRSSQRAETGAAESQPQGPPAPAQARIEAAWAAEIDEIGFLRAEVERLHAALEREQYLVTREQDAHRATRRELTEARDQLRRRDVLGSTQQASHASGDGASPSGESRGLRRLLGM